MTRVPDAVRHPSCAAPQSRDPYIPAQPPWAPDQQRTARALRCIRGTRQRDEVKKSISFSAIRFLLIARLPSRINVKPCSGAIVAAGLLRRVELVLRTDLPYPRLRRPKTAAAPGSGTGEFLRRSIRPQPAGRAAAAPNCVGKRTGLLRAQL